MAVVSMKNLLEAGVHFGHQTRRWHPKMKPYIFAMRNEIYILDLQQTLGYIEKAFEYVSDLTSNGGTILFVGTKKQAQESIRNEATRCGMPYVSHRWLGGILTNFKTIKNRIDRLKQLEELETSGQMNVFPKKEQSVLRKEKDKLEKNLGGLRDMDRIPDAIFVVDSKKERIAIFEARKIETPIVAIIDTNCDPDEVDMMIPGNDDAIRSISLITKVMADAVVEGKARREASAQAAKASAEAEKAAADQAAQAAKAAVATASTEQPA